MMDPKKKAIEELMGYLDEKDGEELGAAVEPKGLGVEVTKVEKIGDDGESVSPGMDAMASSEAGSEMAPEELEELIEAIQSKLG